MLWSIFRWFLPPSPCWKHKVGGFLQYLREDLLRFLEVKCTEVWETPMTGAPWGFQSQSWPHGPSSNSSVTLALAPGGFCPWVSALVCCGYLYHPVCLYHLGGASLPCDLTSLMDPRRVVAISVCSAFHLLAWSGF